MKGTGKYVWGYLDGLKAASWQCVDCGNTYDSTVDACPNLLLDQAYVNARGVGE